MEGRRSRREIVAAGHAPAAVDRVLKRIKASEFKRRMPPIAKLSPRSVGHDFLYPYDWGK